MYTTLEDLILSKSTTFFHQCKFNLFVIIESMSNYIAISFGKAKIVFLLTSLQFLHLIFHPNISHVFPSSVFGIILQYIGDIANIYPLLYDSSYVAECCVFYSGIIFMWGFLICLIITIIPKFKKTFFGLGDVPIYYIKTLGRLLYSYVCFLYQPLLGLFVRQFECTIIGNEYVLRTFPEVQCFSGIQLIHIIFSILCLILVVIFSVVLMLILFNTESAKMDALGRWDNYSNVYEFGWRTVILLELTFGFSDWIIIMTTLCGAIFHLEVYTTIPKYQQYEVQKMWRIGIWFQIWCGAVLAACKLETQLEISFFGINPGLIFLVFPIIFLTILFERDSRRQLLLKNEKSLNAMQMLGKCFYFHIISLFTFLKREYVIILKGYIHTHLEKCLSSECSLREFHSAIHSSVQLALEKIRKSSNTSQNLLDFESIEANNRVLVNHNNILMKEIMKKFPSARNIRIIYAQFLLEAFEIPCYVIHHIKILEQIPPNFFESFLLYRFKSVISQKIHSKSTPDSEYGIKFKNFISYQKKSADLRNSMESYTKVLLKFWDVIGENLIDMKAYKHCSFIAYKLISYINEDYSEIERIWKNSKTSLIYKKFCSQVLQDPKAHADMLELKNIFENENHLPDWTKRIGENMNNISTYSTHGIPTIFFSAALDSEGIINKCNSAACAFLGYKKEELLGNSIDMILPVILKGTHQILIQKVSQKILSSKVVEKKEIFVYGMNSAGYVIPMNLRILLFPSLFNDNHFVAQLYPPKFCLQRRVRDFIILDTQQRITAVSSGCYFKIGISSLMASLNSLQIGQIIPALEAHFLDADYRTLEGKTVECINYDTSKIMEAKCIIRDLNMVLWKRIGHVIILEWKSEDIVNNTHKYNINWRSQFEFIPQNTSYLRKLVPDDEIIQTYHSGSPNSASARSSNKILKHQIQQQFSNLEHELFSTIQETDESAIPESEEEKVKLLNPISKVISDIDQLKVQSKFFSRLSASVKNLQIIDRNFSHSVFDEQFIQKLEIRSSNYQNKIKTKRIDLAKFIFVNIQEERCKSTETLKKNEFGNNEKDNIQLFLASSLLSKDNLHESLKQTSKSKLIIFTYFWLYFLLVLFTFSFFFEYYRFRDLTEILFIRMELFVNSISRISNILQILFLMRELLLVKNDLILRMEDLDLNIIEKEEYTTIIYSSIKHSLDELIEKEKIVTDCASEKDWIYLNSNNITMNFYYDNGKTLKKRKKSLHQGVLHIISEADKILSTNLDEISESSSSILFIMNNGYGLFLRSLRRSVTFFLQESKEDLLQMNALEFIIEFFEFFNVLLGTIWIVILSYGIEIYSERIAKKVCSIPKKFLKYLKLSSSQFLHDLDMSKQEGTDLSISPLIDFGSIKAITPQNKKIKGYRNSLKKLYPFFGICLLCYFFYNHYCYYLLTSLKGGYSKLVDGIEYSFLIFPGFVFTTSLAREYFNNNDFEIFGLTAMEENEILQDDIRRGMDLMENIENWGDKAINKEQLQQIISIYEKKNCEIYGFLDQNDCPTYFDGISNEGLIYSSSYFINLVQETYRDYEKHQNKDKTGLIKILASDSLQKAYQITNKIFFPLEKSLRKLFIEGSQSMLREKQFLKQILLSVIMTFIILTCFGAWTPIIGYLQNYITKNVMIVTLLPLNVIAYIKPLHKYFQQVSGSTKI